MPVSSVHPYRHNTLPSEDKHGPTQTNTFPTQSQIVSRDVTLKVQKRLEGCCRQKTSQFSIVNTPREMFRSCHSVWFSLRNPHLTHSGKVDLLGSVQQHVSQGKEWDQSQREGFPFSLFLWSESHTNPLLWTYYCGEVQGKKRSCCSRGM